MPQVRNGLQARFPLQLRVHPGNIRSQLLLQSVDQIHTNPTNHRQTHSLDWGPKKGWDPWHNKWVPLFIMLGQERGGQGQSVVPLPIKFYFPSEGQSILSGVEHSNRVQPSSPLFHRILHLYRSRQVTWRLVVLDTLQRTRPVLHTTLNTSFKDNVAATFWLVCGFFTRRGGAAWCLISCDPILAYLA